MDDNSDKNNLETIKTNTSNNTLKLTPFNLYNIKNIDELPIPLIAKRGAGRSWILRQNLELITQIINNPDN